MTPVMHLRWLAALTLAIALAPGSVSALEEGTIKLSGPFRTDYAYGELDMYYFDPNLLTVYYNGNEHTWTLTLHGTTQTHYTNGSYYGTEIRATSFELEFFGPDAATLNGLVSDHLAGGDVYVYLQNTYYDYGGGFAVMHVWVSNGDPGMTFYTGNEMGVSTLFPTDANGYPVVELEPFSIAPDYTELGCSDMLSGTGGAIGSLAGPVTIEGSVGQPEPEEPASLGIADAAVVEGDRGSSKVAVAVTLSHSSSAEVTVRYATANGSALAKSDYSATSGALTFPAGQTRRTISLSIAGDRKREPNETFSVQLSSPVGATIADGVATVTILNDD
ncbi:MAG: Calx-beta domain-containing protein [Aureliella sp.]